MSLFWTLFILLQNLSWQGQSPLSSNRDTWRHSTCSPWHMANGGSQRETPYLHYICGHNYQAGLRPVQHTTRQHPKEEWAFALHHRKSQVIYTFHSISSFFSFRCLNYGFSYLHEHLEKRSCNSPIWISNSGVILRVSFSLKAQG